MARKLLGSDILKHKICGFLLGAVMARDLNRLRKCFQPRQWFQGEGEPDPSISNCEAFMWVYRKLDSGKFCVGYFMPDGTWFSESEFADAGDAAARVNFLNGGGGSRGEGGKDAE